MAAFFGIRRSSPSFWKGCLWSIGLAACTLCPALPAHAQESTPQDAWKAALAARQSFEAEPKEEHTRDEFTQVMDNFRAIYHANPADLHAPRAVDQVAQLLAEQGRELKDPKSLRAAAGQYEFLAKAYPASSLAAPGLATALDLLGPEGANDPDEATKVRALLDEKYPREARRAEAAGQGASPSASDSASESTTQELRQSSRQRSAGAARGQGSGTPEAPRTSVADAENPTSLPATRRRGAPVVAASAVAPPLPTAAPAAGNGSPAPAVVTGIRHWSTASYTRVAIDLGGEVKFQAARVEHPDRIFFDLHGAKLAPGLAGKSFAVTDDGFLKTIRAGQFGPDVTRVVLDVQPVAEYSAFLLPNPYRLIIDIHGKPGQRVSESAALHPSESGDQQLGDPASQQVSKSAGQRVSRPANQPPSAAGRVEQAQTASKDEQVASAQDQPPAPVSRVAPAASGEAIAAASSLPPMPVTDGSSSFGLPPRRDQPVESAETVARPRVVVPAKPTTAKPVPNTVTSSVPESNHEVADVSDQPGVVTATAKPTSKPVVDKTPVPGHRAQPTKGAPIEPPPPTSDGQSTLMRALGLKIGRIVIDAGHGGHDSGTLGPEGIEEKDVVLDVALRLGKLLHDRLGAEVVYTRADDTFIPLETRTAIANKAQADLFISVHANSSQDPDARGVEVYYLNFTSDPEAMQVASRENAVSSARVNQLSDLVKKIALKDKIDESRELAADVDQSLYSGLKKGNAGLKDRGVKKAPFVVLIGANMPSILAEISFVTNPEDAAELNTPAYRERVAESLYNGVARYAAAINGGVKPGRSRVRPTERAER